MMSISPKDLPRWHGEATLVDEHAPLLHIYAEAAAEDIGADVLHLPNAGGRDFFHWHANVGDDQVTCA